MKRIIATFALILSTASVYASDIRREDALLTGDGTLFLVREMSPSDVEGLEIDPSSRSLLVLTTLRDGEKTSFVVPGSTSATSNSEPTLEWDASEGRLYLFWLRRPFVTSSELVITSWKDGVWGNESTFGAGRWTWRQNLHLALTHRLEKEMPTGEIVEVDGLTVHAIWWNQEGSLESAMYAMFTLNDGEIVAYTSRPLSDFVAAPQAPAELPEGFDRNILRTPFILDSNHAASIDVFFADWLTGNYHLVTLTPRETNEGRLRIPIGVASGPIGPPLLNRSTEQLMLARAPGAGTTFVVFSVSDGGIEYVRYIRGVRQDARVLQIDGDLTIDRAISALERLAKAR